MTTLQVDLKGIKSVQSRLKGVVTDIKKATAGGINDTTKQIRTQASQEIRTTLNVRKKDLDRYMVRRFASRDSLTGVLKIRDVELPLKAFRPRQTKKGVNVRIRKGASMQHYKSAFGPKIKRLGGHVYKRRGSRRLPIDKLPGVQLVDEIKAGGTIRKIRRGIKRRLTTNIDRRVKRSILRRQQRAA